MAIIISILFALGIITSPDQASREMADQYQQEIQEYQEQNSIIIEDWAEL